MTDGGRLVPPKQRLLFCLLGEVGRVTKEELGWSQKSREPDRPSGILQWTEAGGQRGS